FCNQGLPGFVERSDREPSPDGDAATRKCEIIGIARPCDLDKLIRPSAVGRSIELDRLPEAGLPVYERYWCRHNIRVGANALGAVELPAGIFEVLGLKVPVGNDAMGA